MDFSQKFFVLRRDEMSGSRRYFSRIDEQSFWLNSSFNCFNSIVHILGSIQSTLDVIITERKFRALPLAIKINKLFGTTFLRRVWETGRIITDLAEEKSESQKNFEKIVDKWIEWILTTKLIRSKTLFYSLFASFGRRIKLWNKFVRRTHREIHCTEQHNH